MAIGDPDAEVGEGLIGGNNGRLRSDVKAGLRIDTSELSKLKNSLKEAKNITTEWRKEMEKLSEAAANAAGNINAASGGKGGGGNYLPASLSPGKANSSGGQGGGGAGGGGGSSTAPTPPPPSRAGRVAGAVGTGAAALATAIKPLIDAVNQRIDSGINYATSADRLNVLTQQMTGMSQMQVMQDMRRPLTQYRLGEGGVNALMQFQTSTGVRVSDSYAGSIAGIRASTGYSKSTADILAEQQQLMRPEVANRMFFMGGVNAFNIGGGLRDPLQMRQEIVQRMGLDNPAIAESALMPGSVTRARMADMGIGEAMQTEVLQYAQQQVQFREKGGKGMYDPSKASDRQLMGIEDNLATQQEETGRTQTEREERFMRRQIDNMANMEKINQELIKALGSLEDTFSAAIGLKTTTRGLGRTLGPGLGALGMGAMALGPVTGGAGYAIGGALLLGSALLGDGDTAETARNNTTSAPSHSATGFADGSRDNMLMVPSGGRGSKRIPLSEFKRSSRFTSLQPSLRNKLLNMMRENPNVGINSGYRDDAAQERLFYQQMEETSADQSEVEWDGRYWKPKSGKPFTAPPGRSMHGVGLAADIFEEGHDYSWIVANSSRFGLNNWRAKGWRHDEPWHVQPQEAPRFRSQFDGGQYVAPSTGRPDGWFEDNADETFSGGGYMVPHETQSALSSASHLSGNMGLPLPALIDAHQKAGLARFLSGGTGSYGSSTGVGSSASSSSTSAMPANSKLTGEQMARLAYNAGFRGDDLATALAVAYAESNWRTGAHNPNASTGDNSFGLFQINMLGALGPDRLQRYGLNRNEDLYDPQTNARVAYSMFSSSGFSPWSTWKRGEHEQYMDIARNAISSADVGDPSPMYMPSRRQQSGSNGNSRSTTNHYTSSPTINVAPVINFNGAPNTPDLKRIAQSVSKLIKEEVDMLDLRTA